MGGRVAAVSRVVVEVTWTGHLAWRRAASVESFGVRLRVDQGLGLGLLDLELLIGEGGFGCVYRGVVKIHDEANDCRNLKLDGHKEWINEVSLLGVVKHPNLLGRPFLARMHSLPLPWLTRLKIAQDAARGLAYLHEEMDLANISDFKTSNVLLDEDFNAKLSDFGLARQGPSEGFGHVVGTVGYAAPEYVQTGRLTAKSDVWSFGVVLFELITGRRALERIYLESRPRMGEVVEMLGNIISETSCQDEGVSRPVRENEDVKEESGVELEAESTKQGHSYLKKDLVMTDDEIANGKEK
ncbi:myosin-2 heavy chain-like isoform X1 [Hibiscus syriacus]|uniref:Myosin-2 heavy chain-like isoform X1 n=1 Tax=Hibiscus syriacus TaxID=106335 RepID=A0A6A2ZYA1_HIBSY|nr:myosin-2 heavy chain-like isoform X1 [Hibiscus syriacus]